MTETINCGNMKNPELVIGDKWQLADGKGKLSLKSLDVAVLVFDK